MLGQIETNSRRKGCMESSAIYKRKRRTKYCNLGWAKKHSSNDRGE
jgi:hypothetical protein